MTFLSSPVRIGVCGIGAIGSAHAAALSGGKINGAVLAALCDISEERKAKCAELYPDVPFFDSSDEMLESGLIDAVVISVPHYFHVPIARAAFARGIHVLSEKPIAVAASEAEAAVKEAEEKGLVYCVMFNQRTSGVYRRAKEIVSSGALGELRRLVFIATAWYRTQHYYNKGGWRATWNGEGGGVLLNQAPHNLDMWQWIFGMPEKLYADCGISLWHDIEVEDDAVITASYKNGAKAVFITTTGDMPGTARLEITGSRGKIIVENKTLTYISTDKDEREVRNTEMRSSYRPKTEKEVFSIEEKERDGHEIVLENFAAVLCGKEKELICPAREALGALYISNAAYLSAYKASSVSVPCSSAEFNAMLEEYRKNGKQPSEGAVECHSKYEGRWQP